MVSVFGSPSKTAVYTADRMCASQEPSVEEPASHARTCDQLHIPLALALHELHIVARSRPVDARAPSARALDLHVGQRLILKQAHADRSAAVHTSTIAFERGKKRGQVRHRG